MTTNEMERHSDYRTCYERVSFYLSFFICFVQLSEAGEAKAEMVRGIEEKGKKTRVRNR